MPMIRQKLNNFKSCKTLNITNIHNKKLSYLSNILRLVKPALENIKNGEYITDKEFGAWLDSLE